MMLAQGQKSDARQEILTRIWRVDADGSGALDREEVRQVLIQMGRPREDIDLDAAMEELDADGDGRTWGV